LSNHAVRRVSSFGAVGQAEPRVLAVAAQQDVARRSRELAGAEQSDQDVPSALSRLSLVRSALQQRAPVRRRIRYLQPALLQHVDAHRHQRVLAGQTAFDVFMTDVNEFFAPTSSRDFRKIVDIFQGTLGEEVGEWKITPSASTFRRVVYRGEIQPAQWPKYKYLLLELWRGTGTELETSLCRQRDIARQQVFNSLEKEYQKEFTERTMRRLDTLIPTEVTAIRDEAYDAFGKFLRNLGWKASEVPSKKTLIEAAVQTEDASEAPVVPNEDWAVAEITVPNADET
jgi:hypothetical protein